MVNTGKPSTGCANCKKRKIKCDERRPYCLRCEKVGKECPGVPAPLDFVFRPGKSVASNGGAATPKKSESRSKQQLRDVRGRTNSSDSFNDSADFAEPFTRQPNLSLENQGVTIFFKDVVMLPQNEVLGNVLSCLPSVYANASSTSPLRYAVAANAISTLRSYLRRPSLWGAALWYYGQALEAMRDAMGSDQRVIGDDVIMSVMLLKLFENQLGCTRNIIGYEYHTTAAAALLVKRGNVQLSSPSSLRLFRTIRWHVFIVSLQSGRFPNALYSGCDWFADRDVHDEHSDSSRMLAAAFELPLLRCQAASILGQPDHLRVKSEVMDLLIRATRIDKDLEDWSALLGEEWRPQVDVLHSDPLVDTWSGIAHIFSGPVAALHLNTYRILRIIASGIAMRCAGVLATTGDASSETTAAHAVTILQTMVDDICASVPWHLNYWPDFGTHNGPDSTAAGWSGSGGAYFLIWPLFIAMSVDTVPVEQREWCCRKLRDVGTEFGYRQALTVADTFQY